MESCEPFPFYIPTLLSHPTGANLFSSHPKKSHPNMVVDFRSIVLYNMIYKLIYKVLFNIIKDNLDHLVMQEQHVLYLIDIYNFFIVTQNRRNI